VDARFSFHHQLRDRILPALAELDGIGDALGDVQRYFDTLCARDLDFDLRAPPPFSSNLCEQDCAIELAYTFGGGDNTGVRYSFEPTCRRSALKNRYTLCRDRVRAAMREAGDGYDASAFRRLFKVGLPNDVLLNTTDDPTATICAIHHYRDRPPRLKMYFSVDYADDARALAQIRALVGELDDDTISAQVEEFLAAFDPPGGGRMVGLDFEPGRPIEVKVYKMGAGLSDASFAALVERSGGGQAAREQVAAFQQIFLDGDSAPERFNLVTLGARREGAPRLKLYIRPVDLYGDGEALARVRAWYAHLDKADELALVERGLAAVAPLDVLDATRGFFNYLSVDVSERGLDKTSVYYAPLVPLAHLAQQAPERLQSLG
jgi:hypothetical protein